MDLHFDDAVSRSRAGSRDVCPDAMTFEHRRLPRWKEGRGDARAGANPAAADMVDRGRLEVAGLSHALADLSLKLRCFFREGVSRVLAAVAPIDAETGARRPLDVIYTNRVDRTG